VPRHKTKAVESIIMKIWGNPGLIDIVWYTKGPVISADYWPDADHWPGARWKTWKSYVVIPQEQSNGENESLEDVRVSF
jgi:hypothetical protein